MTLVYVGLGSNLGRREEHLAHALARLAGLARDGRLAGVSTVFETDPVGDVDQPRFLNLVARFETDLAPAELLHRIRAIEAERSRERSFRNAPRTLDIDVLLYGDHEVYLDDLTVPHPRMNDRRFVLVPLLELDPHLLEPGTGRRYADILGSVGLAPEIVPAMKGEQLLDPPSEERHGP